MSASKTFVEFEAIVDSFRARNDWCVWLDHSTAQTVVLCI